MIKRESGETRDAGDWLLITPQCGVQFVRTDPPCRRVDVGSEHAGSQHRGGPSAIGVDGL